MAGWLFRPALAFLALAPLIAAAAGLWVHSGNWAVRHAQQSWHEVQGVLLRSAAGRDDG